MDATKKAFVLYLDYKENLDMLTHEQKGILLDMIFEYALTGDVIETEPIIKMAFSFIKNHLDRDMKKYQKTCERNRNNGKLGGRPKKQMDNLENPKKPSGYLEKPTEPKKPDKDIDKDIDKDTDKDIDKDTNNKKSSRFTPPTLEEVQQYCRERGNNIDAETFIDFYATKGWMVGKNKMKDWKAAIRTWEKRNNENSQEVEKDKVEKGVVSSAEPKPTMDPSKFYSDEYINNLPY